MSHAHISHRTDALVDWLVMGKVSHLSRLILHQESLLSCSAQLICRLWPMVFVFVVNFCIMCFFTRGLHVHVIKRERRPFVVSLWWIQIQIYKDRSPTAKITENEIQKITRQ